MNITDIDDKMIKRANELGVEVKEVAAQYTRSFIKDMDALGMNSVNLYAKATEHVPEIIAQINVLIEKGYAYEVDGNVYFEVKKLKDFGKLSGQTLDGLMAGARVEVDEKKRNPEDFVLWKKKKEGEPYWKSPWGAGRPGWHVEDTAITTTYFGAQYDIHGGGTELIFPHHESEIAIAESATGKKPFVRFWLHTGNLNVTGEKMSKSLENFITIKDLLKRYKASVVRFFLLYTNYRSPIDFAYDDLEEAKRSLERIKNTIKRVKSTIESAKIKEPKIKMDKEILGDIEATRQKFIEAMDDDFNTREAIATIFDFTRRVNKWIESKEINIESLKAIIDLYGELGTVLGLFQEEKKVEEKLTPELMELVLEIRERIRDKKDWALADEIRNKLGELGIVLEDGAKGAVWKIEK
jgi:cysteinyl-tRNA synthetase